MKKVPAAYQSLIFPPWTGASIYRPAPLYVTGGKAKKRAATSWSSWPVYSDSIPLPLLHAGKALPSLPRTTYGCRLLPLTTCLHRHPFFTDGRQDDAV